jgi:hypothetical protein
MHLQKIDVDLVQPPIEVAAFKAFIQQKPPHCYVYVEARKRNKISKTTQAYATALKDANPGVSFYCAWIGNTPPSVKFEEDVKKKGIEFVDATQNEKHEENIKKFAITAKSILDSSQDPII